MLIPPAYLFTFLNFLILIVAVISVAVKSNPRPANVPTIGVHASDESDDGNQTEENYVRKNPGRIKMDDSVIKKKKDGPTKGISLAELDLRTGSPRISELDKGEALSVEEKWGTGKVVKMSGPISQEQECSDNFKDDNTGKLLPITLEKQREDIPTIQENIDVRANIIFLDRDYLEEQADPRIPNQQETSLQAVSSSGSSNQGEESQSEGQDNIKIVDPKKRKWFKPFSWWQKK